MLFARKLVVTGCGMMRRFESHRSRNLGYHYIWSTDIFVLSRTSSHNDEYSLEFIETCFYAVGKYQRQVPTDIPNNVLLRPLTIFCQHNQKIRRLQSDTNISKGDS